MKFYTTISDAPLRIQAYATAQMMRERGYDPSLQRHDRGYVGPRYFSNHEARDRFFRRHIADTDRIIRAIMAKDAEREALRRRTHDAIPNGHLP